MSFYGMLRERLKRINEIVEEWKEEEKEKEEIHLVIEKDGIKYII